MKVFHSWKIKNPADKKLFKSEQVVENYYGKEELGKQVKRMHFIHYVFKYKIFVPFVVVIRKIIGKRLVKQIPDEAHLKYVKLFDEIINEAVVEWEHIYINGLRKQDKRLTKGQCKKKYQEATTSTLYILRTMKEIANTVAVNDDAYPELITFILWRTYFRMNKLVSQGVKDHLLRSVTREIDPLDELVYLRMMKVREDQYKMEKAGEQK